MKLLTRNTDYSVRALCYIAERGDQIVPVTELSQNLNIPRPFLRKILQVLNQKNLLKSYQGQGGGFTLACKPASILVADVMKIFQGSVSLTECRVQDRDCRNRKCCPLKDRIDDIENYATSVLNSITIAALIEKKLAAWP